MQRLPREEIPRCVRDGLIARTSCDQSTLAPDALMIGARSCSCLRRNWAVSAGLIQFVVAACWMNVFFRFSLASALLVRAAAFSTMAGGRPAGPHRPPHEVMLKPG